MSAGDRQEIVDLLVAYATAIDTKDWELFRTLFTDDCIFDVAGVPIEGADDLTRRMQVLHEPLDGSRHHIGNEVVAVGEDDARATCYLDALLVQRRHPEGPTVRVSGSYEDDLVNDSGRWRIRHRRFHFLWSEGNTALLSPT
jgi:uncharacterized protein (TIGR02246 family)